MASTIFSQKEVEYIKSQRLARIATAARSSVASSEEGQQTKDRSIQPDVVPVGFDFDGDYFYVGGMNIKSTKYKNVLKNNKVAIVIDDLKSAEPRDPRGIKVYGTADIVTRQGGYMDGTGHANPTYIRVKPDKKWSWGARVINPDSDAIDESTSNLQNNNFYFHVMNFFIICRCV